METFKKFVDNTRILGFKGKLPLIREIIDEQTSKNYENLFYSLNILSEEINSLSEQNSDNILKYNKKHTPLNSNELQIYKKYFESEEETNISSFNENQQLLELSLDEINNDNYILDLEIENLEQEIALNEQLLSNEKEDNDLLEKRKKNISTYNPEFFSHKLENFKKENIDVIKQDTLLLNKSLRNIGTELDLNIKKSSLQKNTPSYIVNYRKINDTQFDESMKLLIDIIYQFEHDYDKIQRKIKLEKNDNDDKDDIMNIYMKEIIKTEDQMKKVMNTEIELNKNNFLYFIQKSKIIYEINLIKEYLKNPKCLEQYYNKYIESKKKNKNDMSSSAITVELSKKIKQIFSFEENEIFNKFIKIKNNYYQKILDKYLSLKFQDQIIFIENLDKYEKILNSIYPYIIDDENITQLIYDTICDVTEIYNSFQTKIGVKQGFLRQKYSKIVEPINKITIDERDDVLLKLAMEYLGNDKEEDENYQKKYSSNKNKTKSNNYHIYEIKKIIDKMVYIFKNLKSKKSSDIIDKIYSDIINNLKDYISFLKIFLNNQDYLIDVKKLNKQYKNYKENTKFILYEFNQNIDKIILKKNVKSRSNLAIISIFDALYLYLFHRDIYNKEFPNNTFIFNLYIIYSIPRNESKNFFIYTKLLLFIQKINIFKKIKIYKGK